MAVVLLALGVTVVVVVAAAEEGESSGTRAIGCGRNTGTWTSSPNLRRTSISSTPTLAGGLRYVGSVSVLCNTNTHVRLLYVVLLCNRRLN